MTLSLHVPALASVNGYASFTVTGSVNGYGSLYATLDSAAAPTPMTAALTGSFDIWEVAEQGPILEYICGPLEFSGGRIPVSPGFVCRGCRCFSARAFCRFCVH